MSYLSTLVMEMRKNEGKELLPGCKRFSARSWQENSSAVIKGRKSNMMNLIIACKVWDEVSGKATHERLFMSS